MRQQKFSLINRLKSFPYAFMGLKTLLFEEHNARIHLVASFGVIVLSVYFKINAIEWGAVVFSIALVFVAEIFNSAIERISDFISPEHNNAIKKIKDLAAAAVLVSAVASVCIALIIFIPKL